QRPSACAIIANDVGQVALVRTARGVFLPGGGIEAGETAEEAVLREVMEECRLDIRLDIRRLSRLPGAVQLVYSPTQLTYFEKASAFCAAVAERQGEGPPETGHELLRVGPGEAATLVSHESHRWALRRSAS